MNGKQALVEAFGNETGTALYGAAVKLSHRTGIDLDDIVGDMTVEAIAVSEEYGFYYVNTIVNRTKNVLFDSGRYGVNRYYSGQGVSVDSMEALVDDQDDRAPEEALEIESYAFATTADADVHIDTVATLETLGVRDRQIVRGLLAGLTGAEIAERLGVSGSYVSKRKRRMRQAFAWAGAMQHGEASQLTAQEAREIYELATEGELTQDEIGARYRVSGSTVSNIKCGRSWTGATGV